MAERYFGELPAHPPGSLFEGRRGLSAAGIHRPLVAGISGTPQQGADSVVLSGGYEDDQDDGESILYTGAGGRDLNTGRQAAHQSLSRGNLALARSHALGLPLRVSRRLAGSTYRYEGLYRVTALWHDTGQSGYRIWRFRLEPWEAAVTERREVQALRRDSAAARAVKQRHDYTCHPDSD